MLGTESNQQRTRGPGCPRCSECIWIWNTRIWATMPALMQRTYNKTYLASSLETDGSYTTTKPWYKIKRIREVSASIISDSTCGSLGRSNSKVSMMHGEKG